MLWKVIHSGLSAGRVQSVAVRLVCERDREIEAFEPQEYWSIEAMLGREGADSFRARLLSKGGEKLEIANEEQSNQIVAELKAQLISVKEVKKRDQLRRPAPPFITSTLQQECARRLRFSVKRTMAVAQQLYEGIEVEGETRGLITYMRTDSVRVADEAIVEVRQQIDQHYGSEYVPEEVNQYKTKNSAQDAHEAIRPTSVALHPDKIRDLLSQDQVRVYELIWKRFVASQMKPLVLSITTVNIEAGPYQLRATGNTVKFPGFTLLYSESKDDEDSDKSGSLPDDIAQGEALKLNEVLPEQHFTKPPPRFTEASLVKELEAKEIGRPSTYAQIITTILDREYVEKVDNRYFEATERGQTVNTLLVDTFPELFNVAFTKDMEERLDRVEDGDDNWVATVQQFHDSWKDHLAAANERRKELKLSLQEESDIVCEECSRNMVTKWGRNGRFLACPGYPECKNTKPLEEQGTVETDEVCDQCNSPMIVKTGRYGRFLACSGYPECKNVKPYFLGIQCPEDDCGGKLVEKQSRKGKIFFGCNNYPSCKFASWDRPVDRKCSHCDAALLYEKSSRSSASILYCRVCNTQYERENSEKNEEDAQAA